MIKWKYQSKTKSCNKRFDIYYTKSIRNKYQSEIKSYLIDNDDQPFNSQNSCNKITKMLKQAAENTIAYVNKSRRSINGDVKELSLSKFKTQINVYQNSD